MRLKAGERLLEPCLWFTASILRAKYSYLPKIFL